MSFSTEPNWNHCANAAIGVGAGMDKYLVPGTQMDVSVSKIGTLRNGVVFA